MALRRPMTFNSSFLSFNFFKRSLTCILSNISIFPYFKITPLNFLLIISFFIFFHDLLCSFRRVILSMVVTFSTFFRSLFTFEAKSIGKSHILCQNIEGNLSKLNRNFDKIFAPLLLCHCPFQ